MSSKVISNPERFSAFDATIKFEIEGKDKGHWIFSCKESLSIVDSDSKADCTITMKDTDLALIANGNINPQELFVTGRIAVTGDTVLALRACEIFDENLGG
ncbi:MAG: SCP2 sterol-binding domain-containing protein [bacterium]|nr:SCP2 sterol-binding domain-containing protein [bacterium]